MRGLGCRGHIGRMLFFKSHHDFACLVNFEPTIKVPSGSGLGMGHTWFCLLPAPWALCPCDH